ncbi:glucose 1-dehydrogenase [Nostoc sp. MG11]|uniref:glucose 1-dehydrogenase n=1 Tax=Nostoc sp. MG11 TaxID=2721166 RepID=UPI0018675294|nr:glucose 1-dehydrogenase [Nostoc sp. MG11]
MSAFTGKVVLVTGGSSGIGRASALAFAKAGAKVVVADVDVTGGEDTVSKIEIANGEAIFVKTDVTKALEVKQLIKKTVEAYGALNCAFNNAGILGHSSSTAACTEENWDRVLNINLKSVWLCMKYEIPYMREQGGGIILNMSSMAGLGSGLQRFPAYTVSKHGVIGLTKTAALEYAKAGIRINALCPGFIHNTPLFESQVSQNFDFKEVAINQVPIGRLGTPEEIAEIAVFLCSDKASFITGHAMVADGAGSMSGHVILNK